MPAVWMRAASELRARWRPWLAILSSLVAALVLAVLPARSAARTRSALALRTE